MRNEFECVIPVCTLENKQIILHELVSVTDCVMLYTDGIGKYVISFTSGVNGVNKEEHTLPVEVFNTCFEIFDRGY